MKREYVAPTLNLNAFNCPRCDAFAHQLWASVTGVIGGGTRSIEGVRVAYCDKCSAYSFWLEDKMIMPSASIAPMPTDDMPDDVEQDYLEARTILAASPRGACALLRLAVQKLVVSLEEKGKDLDKDIGRLVKRGLPAGVQRALDSLRVIGNNAVHPGALDLKDDVETATSLFDALNMVVDVMITQPRSIDELYSKLPENSKEHIQERDSTESPSS